MKKVILALRKISVKGAFQVMWADCKDEMLGFLKEGHEKLDVVVMPDFFHDRLINLDCDAARFSSMIGM